MPPSRDTVLVFASSPAGKRRPWPALSRLALTLAVSAWVPGPLAADGRGPAASAFGSSFVVDTSFEPVFRELIESSSTVRSQCERIAAAGFVRVHVGLTVTLPPDRAAQTEFRRSATGGLEARVEIDTPLRREEYAQWLAHELEHVLEQLEGTDLEGLARDSNGGVNRLVDGVYETERATRAGLRASAEVRAGGRRSARGSGFTRS